MADITMLDPARLIFAAIAGLAVGHAFIPPTPGPVLVASMLGVDLGWVILIGIFCGTIAMIVAGPIWGGFCGKKYMIPVPERLSEQEDIDESKLPHFATIVGIIMIPLLFIICDSVCGVALPADHFVSILFSFLGEPFVAMLIATIVAMLILGLRHRSHRRRLDRPVPLQRLRLLAGQVAGGPGRKDHPQDLDHHGDAGRLHRLPGRAGHFLLRIKRADTEIERKGEPCYEKPDQSENAHPRPRTGPFADRHRLEAG